MVNKLLIFRIYADKDDVARNFPFEPELGIEKPYKPYIEYKSMKLKDIRDVILREV